LLLYRRRGRKKKEKREGEREKNVVAKIDPYWSLPKIKEKRKKRHILSFQIVIT